MARTGWEVVIGLELHMQLKTRSKIFSAASAAYGAPPNSQACAVDIALPGVLPVLNAEAVRMAVAFGLAVDAEIAGKSVFARKNYFYPDLPKGYQISQYELPVVFNGRLDIECAGGGLKTIGIERAHLEEDAGKSVHEYIEEMSGVDLNRAGVPLMEIVSRPQLASAEEAVAYMKKIRSIGCYLGICDGNMQEGSLRCDANVSVRPAGSAQLGTRTETKNLNSFRFVEKAIACEIERQTALLEDGGEVVQETRLYDDRADQTRPMRSKEDAHDYRYFPDPDLPPLVIEPAFIEEVRASLPELQAERCARFVGDYKLPQTDAVQLTATRQSADYFEDCCKAAGTAAPKQVANWMITQLAAALNRDGLEIEDAPVRPQRLAGLLDRIADGTISARAAKPVFEQMWRSSAAADDIIKEQGLERIADSGALEKVIGEVIAAAPKQVGQYRAGKTKVLGYFVGRVMQATEGRADPAEVSRLLKSKLDA